MVARLRSWSAGNGSETHQNDAGPDLNIDILGMRGYKINLYIHLQEIELQEAIFELYNGEEDLVEDLRLVRKTYADSLIHLNILKPEEEKLGTRWSIMI